MKDSKEEILTELLTEVNFLAFTWLPITDSGMAPDNASVMMGSNNVVATKLRTSS